MDAIEAKDSIILQGKKLGLAEIELSAPTHDAPYNKTTILVLTAKQKMAAQKIQNLLSEMRGLALSSDGKNLIITGDLYRLSDWQALYDLNLPASFQFHACIDPDIQLQVKNWIQNEFRSNFLPRPYLQIAPTPILQLPENYRAEELQWRQISDRLGLIVQFQKSQLALEPLVRIHIYVAEVNKKTDSQMGVIWPDQIEAQLSPKFKNTNEIGVFLKGLEQKGLAQILASPNLLARSGSSAQFLAGGEFPIRIVTPNKREVIWKQHGIALQIKPKADRTGRLSVEISTEISLVDDSVQYDGLPGMKTNRMSTHFDLLEAQTIILSGLIRHDWGSSRNGVLGLSHLPILGRLFGSESFRNQKSELIIFVTPELISENVSESPQMPEGWKNHESPN